ncbi:MAG: AraC family transcriptional regulator [Rhizobiales bacterium]|nr:AraC family transcriptional regulator [Hyphomicrobiales bacterium]
MPRVDINNSARFWQAPGMAGLSCLAADFTTHDYAPHSHEAFVIAVTEAGGSEFSSRGRTDEATSSVLLVFNPDEPHSGRMGRSERWLYRGLYLGADAVDAVKRALQLENTPYFTENAFGDDDLIAAFVALHHALETGHDPFEQRELLIDGLGTLFRRHGSGPARLSIAPRDQARMATLRDMIRAHYATDLSLDGMAAEVDLSPFQLIGLFKRATGLTPHAFLTQVRLKAASAALAAGRPIVEAALAAGFYDQSALTRHFKRSYGITPRQWVHAIKA